jgi:hypothetical protein
MSYLYDGYDPFQTQCPAGAYTASSNHQEAPGYLVSSSGEYSPTSLLSSSYELVRGLSSHSIGTSSASAMTSRSTSQGSWQNVTGPWQMSPSTSSTDQDLHFSPPTSSGPPEEQASEPGPLGYPLGFYKLVSDNNHGQYWALNDCFMPLANGRYPPTVVCSR